MDTNIIDTLNRAKNISDELRSLCYKLNDLLKEASDIGLYINLHKEQKRNHNCIQTTLELKNATVNIEFGQFEVKIN